MWSPGTADLKRCSGYIQDFFGLAAVQVPDHHRVAKPLHGFRVAHQLAQIHHVVVPACERRSDHDVPAGQGADIVSITVSKVAGFFSASQVFVGWHPVSREEVAGIGVFDQCSSAAVILVVG